MELYFTPSILALIATWLQSLFHLNTSSSAKVLKVEMCLLGSHHFLPDHLETPSTEAVTQIIEGKVKSGELIEIIFVLIIYSYSFVSWEQHKETTTCTIQAG